MPPSRRSDAPAVVEWDDSGLPTRRRSPRRSVLGSALAAPLTALLALFLIPLSGAFYYAMTTPDQYSGRALVQFRPRATENGGVVGNETTASAAAGYVAYLGTPSTIRSVSGQIGVGTADLRDNMQVQLLPATTSLSITFENGSPDVAARGASALAQIAVQRSTDDPLVSATVLAPAAVPEIPSTPSKALVIGAGGMLGLLLAGVAHFMMAAVRRRSRGAEVEDQASAAPLRSANGSGTVQPARTLTNR